MPPKPKLTPEEKKELKAKKKAERKLRIIETKKQIKREALARELKYGALTMDKHEQEWRKLLINIKIEEMKKDMEFAWNNFQRVVDCKDFKIYLLMEELGQADEQYVMNLQNHVEHINQLLRLFRDRIREMQDDYENQINEIQDNHSANLEDINQSSTEDQNYLKTMIYMLQVARKEHKRLVRAEYFSKIEEEGTKNQQIVQKLRAILETRHLKLWNDTTDFLDNYNNGIKKRRKEHDFLKGQDDSIQRVIGKQLEAIRKSKELIRTLRQKLEECHKFLGRKFSDLQAEHDFFQYAFNTLKSKLGSDTELDYNKLKALTVNYNNAKAYLESLRIKGSHILHVTNVCRKLETQEEKIRPFPVNFLNQLDVPSMEDINEHMAVLFLFWQRAGKADASRYAINEEREFLLTENAILKLRLHHYCQCLSCPQYKPFKLLAKPSNHVTEGALEVLKYKKQGTLDPYGVNEQEHNKEEEDKIEIDR